MTTTTMTTRQRYHSARRDRDDSTSTTQTATTATTLGGRGGYYNNDYEQQQHPPAIRNSSPQRRHRSSVATKGYVIAQYSDTVGTTTPTTSATTERGMQQQHQHRSRSKSPRNGLFKMVGRQQQQQDGLTQEQRQRIIENVCKYTGEKKQQQQQELSNSSSHRDHHRRRSRGEPQQRIHHHHRGSGADDDDDESYHNNNDMRRMNATSTTTALLLSEETSSHASTSSRGGGDSSRRSRTPSSAIRREFAHHRESIAATTAAGSNSPRKKKKEPSSSRRTDPETTAASPAAADSVGNRSPSQPYSVSVSQHNSRHQRHIITNDDEGDDGSSPQQQQQQQREATRKRQDADVRTRSQSPSPRVGIQGRSSTTPTQRKSLDRHKSATHDVEEEEEEEDGFLSGPQHQPRSAQDAARRTRSQSPSPRFGVHGRRSCTPTQRRNRIGRHKSAAATHDDDDDVFLSSPQRHAAGQDAVAARRSKSPSHRMGVHGRRSTTPTQRNRIRRQKNVADDCEDGFLSTPQQKRAVIKQQVICDTCGSPVTLSTHVVNNSPGNHSAGSRRRNRQDGLMRPQKQSMHHPTAMELKLQQLAANAAAEKTSPTTTQLSFAKKSPRSLLKWKPDGEAGVGEPNADQLQVESSPKLRRSLTDWETWFSSPKAPHPEQDHNDNHDSKGKEIFQQAISLLWSPVRNGKKVISLGNSATFAATTSNPQNEAETPSTPTSPGKSHWNSVRHALLKGSSPLSADQESSMENEANDSEERPHRRNLDESETPSTPESPARSHWNSVRHALLKAASPRQEFHNAENEVDDVEGDQHFRVLQKPSGNVIDNSSPTRTSSSSVRSRTTQRSRNLDQNTATPCVPRSNQVNESATLSTSMSPAKSHWNSLRHALLRAPSGQKSHTENEAEDTEENQQFRVLRKPSGEVVDNGSPIRTSSPARARTAQPTRNSSPMSPMRGVLRLPSLNREGTMSPKTMPSLPSLRRTGSPRSAFEDPSESAKDDSTTMTSDDLAASVPVLQFNPNEVLRSESNHDNVTTLRSRDYALRDPTPDCPDSPCISFIDSDGEEIATSKSRRRNVAKKPTQWDDHDLDPNATLLGPSGEDTSGSRTETKGTNSSFWEFVDQSGGSCSDSSSNLLLVEKSLDDCGLDAPFGSVTGPDEELAQRKKHNQRLKKKSTKTTAAAKSRSSTTKVTRTASHNVDGTDSVSQASKQNRRVKRSSSNNDPQPPSINRPGSTQLSIAAPSVYNRAMSSGHDDSDSGTDSDNDNDYGVRPPHLKALSVHVPTNVTPYESEVDQTPRSTPLKKRLGFTKYFRNSKRMNQADSEAIPYPNLGGGRTNTTTTTTRPPGAETSDSEVSHTSSAASSVVRRMTFRHHSHSLLAENSGSDEPDHNDEQSTARTTSSAATRRLRRGKRQ